MLTRFKALWTTEPARVTTILVAVIIFVAAKLGLIVDEQNVGEALALLLPILLGGEIVRAKVTPALGPAGPDSDALLQQAAIEHIDTEDER
jgi:hypothetical protein